jgi:hypothetical protein
MSACSQRFVCVREHNGPNIAATRITRWPVSACRNNVHEAFQLYSRLSMACIGRADDDRGGNRWTGQPCTKRISSTHENHLAIRAGLCVGRTARIQKPVAGSSIAWPRHMVSFLWLRRGKLGGLTLRNRCPRPTPQSRNSDRLQLSPTIAEHIVGYLSNFQRRVPTF